MLKNLAIAVSIFFFKKYVNIKCNSFSWIEADPHWNILNFVIFSVVLIFWNGLQYKCQPWLDQRQTYARVTLASLCKSQINT